MSINEFGNELPARPVNLIFPDRRKYIASGRCQPPPFGCGAPEVGEFRDLLSLQEYRISGMCQKCQDEVFGV